MDNQNLFQLFERTLKNCHFYQKEGLKNNLLNEIGCLRGIFYCIESMHMVDMLDSFMYDEFIYFITNYQNKMLIDVTK